MRAYRLFLSFALSACAARETQVEEVSSRCAGVEHVPEPRCPPPTALPGGIDCRVTLRLPCPDGFEEEGHLCAPTRLKPASLSEVRGNASHVREVLEATKSPTESAVQELYELAKATPHPVVLARLAEHEEALHHFARALDAWRTLLSLSDKWLAAKPELRKRAESAVPRLQALVANLVVTTHPQALMMSRSSWAM